MSRTSKSSHVILVGKFALCRGCGRKHDLWPGGEPREIWEISALATAFANEHEGCRPENPADLRCACCGEAGHQFDDCNVAHRLTKHSWIDGYDTGLSSTTVWCFMMGVPFERYIEHPWGPKAPSDPSDFGRCYRLLHLAPEWRGRMSEMANVPGWAKVAPAWQELTALFEAELKRKDGTMPKLFARLGELRESR
jgi:hypothetical protein